MDQGLPIVDGVSVLSAFKNKCKEKNMKQLPVLMLSAYDEEFFKKGLLKEVGVTEY